MPALPSGLGEVEEGDPDLVRVRGLPVLLMACARHWALVQFGDVPFMARLWLELG